MAVRVLCVLNLKALPDWAVLPLGYPAALFNNRQYCTFLPCSGNPMTSLASAIKIIRVADLGTWDTYGPKPSK